MLVGDWDEDTGGTAAAEELHRGAPARGYAGAELDPSHTARSGTWRAVPALGDPAAPHSTGWVECRAVVVRNQVGAWSAAEETSVAGRFSAAVPVRGAGRGVAAHP